MCRPGSGASKKLISSSDADVFSTGTIASAPAGTGAPVAICTASPLPTIDVGPVPDHRAAHLLQLDGGRGGGVGDVGRAHREAVHRRRRERGQVVRGDDVLGQDAAVRVGQRQLERGERLDLREDVLAHLLDGTQSLAGVVIVDPGVVGHGGQSTVG